jgi:hypothetical protein
LAAAVLTAAGVSFGARADACNPGPKPGPSSPLASIDLSSETITGNSGDATVSPIDFGSDISLTIPNKAAPKSYRLTIPLSSDESLAVLSTGGAVITQTLPIPPGDYPGAVPPADYQDSSDEGDDSEGIAPTPDDGTGDIEENQDPSWYPEGDAVDSDTRDGWDIANDASDQASNDLPDGNWVIVSAFDPPNATDAHGQSVPISLAKSSDGLTLSISRRPSLSKSSSPTASIQAAMTRLPPMVPPPVSAPERRWPERRVLASLPRLPRLALVIQPKSSSLPRAARSF